MCIKLFPIVYSLHFIAFLLVALLPVVYVYIRAFIKSLLRDEQDVRHADPFARLYCKTWSKQAGSMNSRQVWQRQDTEQSDE